MTGLKRGMLGVALLVAVALTAGAVQLVGDGRGDDDLLVVRGTISSEKEGFLDNPEVRAILADEYGLQVEYTTAGSLEVMEVDPVGQDFLWPASPISLEASYDPPPNSEEIFFSPIVLYSWAPVTDALAAAGLVEYVDGTYYLTDFPRLVAMVESGTEWSEIGLRQLTGPILITTTDPTTSNSGSSFAGLLVTTLVGGEVVDETTVDDVLGRVQEFYARLGPLDALEQTSGYLFNRFVEQGMSAYPIIAGYESSLIEFSLSNEDGAEEIQRLMRVLYPRPTVLSSHPLIALTPNGERLQKALLSSDLQRVARERHGFRSGLLGAQNDATGLEVEGVPPTIGAVMPLPRPTVMKRVIEAIESRSPAAALAEPINRISFGDRRPPSHLL